MSCWCDDCGRVLEPSASIVRKLSRVDVWTLCLDCWRAMRAASTRRTSNRVVLVDETLHVEREHVMEVAS